MKLHLSVYISYFLFLFILFYYNNVCDVIKQNESELTIIDFEI